MSVPFSIDNNIFSIENLIFSSKPYLESVGLNLSELDIIFDINKAFNIGLIIMLIGFLFKVSAAPFYQWAPDVYESTPTIVTV
jgi:NADH-ubiquinone oxidoreductase chain 2